MIIEPNNQGWVGMSVRRPCWEEGNYTIVRYVGASCFIGDFVCTREGTLRKGLEFWTIQSFEKRSFVDDWESVEIYRPDFFHSFCDLSVSFLGKLT